MVDYLYALCGKGVKTFKIKLHWGGGGGGGGYFH